MPQGFRLAQLIAARICHDLGGPVGTVEGALSLLGAGSDEAMAVAREGTATLRLRLTLFRAAWGDGLGDATLAELLALLDGQVAGGRARVAVAAGLSPGTAFAAPVAQLALNAVLLAGDALPRGGVVLLGGDPSSVLMVRPEGEGAAWPAGLAAALAAGGLDPGRAVDPRAVRAPALAALAADLGVPLALGLGRPGDAGPAPLLIGPAPPASAA
jgi:histidine phosphotransferase ChpT